MNTPQTPSERAALAAQMARELADLRDALVTLSLSLKDWQFELDIGARKAAQLQVEQTLAACRSRTTQSDKPAKH